MVLVNPFCVTLAKTDDISVSQLPDHIIMKVIVKTLKFEYYIAYFTEGLGAGSCAQEISKKWLRINIFSPVAAPQYPLFSL